MKAETTRTTAQEERRIGAGGRIGRLSWMALTWLIAGGLMGACGSTSDDGARGSDGDMESDGDGDQAGDGDGDQTGDGDGSAGGGSGDGDGDQTGDGDGVGLGGTPANSLTASLRVLTRPMGISPETVYFSAQGSHDPDCQDFSGGQDREACRTGQYLGFHFDFDDPDSGSFDATGNSKNRQISGSPRAIHTFVCEGEDNSHYNPDSGVCEFQVGVRVQNPAGDFQDAFVDVHIAPQDRAFDLSDTYCVSGEGEFEDCPEGVPAANQLSDTPQPGQFSGRRILYQRGSLTEYSPICVGYDESRVRIDTYGSGSAPLVTQLQVGVAGACREKTPTSQQAGRYPQLQKDDAGHIVSGWAYDIAVASLRLGSVENGMAATLLTMHDLDLDWSDDPTYNGDVALMSSGQNCDDNPDLDCSLVPYPYGVFLSESRALGHPENLPGVNINCFTNCGLVNGGMIGNEAKTAFEHNSRIMGAWGLVVSNVWYRGDHIGGNGGKNKLTLRQISTDTLSSQTVDPENFEDGNHDGTGPGWVRESDTTRHFTPHYNFVVDSRFSDTVQDPTSQEAGFVTMNSGHRYSGIFGATFLMYENAPENPALLSLGGSNVVAVDTRYNDHNITCRRQDSPVHEDGSFYRDSSRIFTDTPDGKCNGAERGLPMPAAPAR